MGNDNIPCCAADAMRRIRQVTINGLLTGICMHDECIAEVKAQDLQSDVEVLAALMIRVKVFNYIPHTTEEHYANALIEEYRKISPEK